jgi:predicted MFS family arabinose efflux permease
MRPPGYRRASNRLGRGASVAVTLSGLQLNISGIVGPALGGLLMPSIGANFVFVANAACFLIVMLTILGVEASNDSITASVGALLRIVRHGDPPRPL